MVNKLEKYTSIVKEILRQTAQYQPANVDVETQLVFDDATHNYQLMYIGWDRSGRMLATVIHIRLVNDKAWIEYDGTEEGVANALLEAGIPKEDIVLAFHPEWKRKHTGFAVA